MQLVKLCKGGRNMILASEATQMVFMRSPSDVHLLAKLIGIEGQQACQATTQQNCARVLQHAHHRRTYRGVAELVEISSDSSSNSYVSDQEESKMQVDTS